MRMDEDQCARRIAQKYLRIVDPDYYEFEGKVFQVSSERARSNQRTWPCRHALVLIPDLRDQSGHSFMRESVHALDVSPSIHLRLGREKDQRVPRRKISRREPMDSGVCASSRLRVSPSSFRGANQEPEFSIL